MMDWIRILLNRCRALFERSRLDADLEDELRAHIDLATAENVQRGMTPGEARTAALRAFGGVTQTRETYRAQRGFPALLHFVGDLRFAFRQLRRSPGFALTAILTLALGIGAVTSVFSVVNGVLLKPFAFRDPDRLVVMREVEEESKGQMAAIPDNYRHFLRLKKDTKTLEDAVIFGQFGVSVSPTGDHPRIVGAIAASPNLFRLLGVQPLLGRDLVDADAEKGAEHVAVLSYEGWQTFFGGNPNVVGQTMRLGGEATTIVGVMPPGLRIPHLALAPSITFQERAGQREVLIFEPLAPTDYDLKTEVGNFNYKVIARLKPGVTVAQASAELGALQAAYSQSAHLPIHLGIAITPLAKDVTSGISGALWLMFAAIVGVLMIACVNLANLQLARAVTGERETAVRAALGANKRQLMMARLAESLVLAAIGGATGMAMAFAGVRLFLSLVPASVPRLNEVHVNLPVMLFAAGLSMLAAMSFGILPAMRSLRVHPQAALQANSTRAANSREGRRTRNLLVASQVACTVVLLIVTSLVLRSFSRLLRQDRGFDASHVTLAEVDLFAPQYGDSHPNVKAIKLEFVDRVLSRLQQLPGVQTATVTSAAPLTGETWVDNLTRPDHPVPHSRQLAINVRWIDQNYLGTMQMPLVAGRNLTAADRNNPYVALISERTAREGFAGENPIGRQISELVPDDKHPVTVIGVVADARINGLKDSAAMVYVPYWAYTPWMVSFLVRSSQGSDALIPEIRRTIWSIDSQVAIPTLKSMDQQVGDSVATDRFQAIVLASFGASALMLAILGIYGVQAYSVTLRRQEFGIRIALGSGKAELIRLVLREAAYPVVLGASAGLVLSIMGLRLVRSVLYQTPVMDPMSIAGSLLLLFVAAGLAAIMPARHAAAVDPMRSLRME
jgi:predicted permease